MSFSSGTFLINSSGQPVVTGTVISSTAFNALTADLATGLSTCVLKDGTQTMTANIPMGGFKFTGLAVGSALTDSASITQVQNQFGSYLTSVSGTNTVLGTATPTPAYAVGQRFTFIPAVTNTGATTLNISSVGAGAVQLDGAALVGGELEAGTPVTVLVTATTPVFEIIPGLSRATQAQQEDASQIGVVVTPGRQHYHPSAAKVWLKWDATGSVLASYGGISSITDTGVGTQTVNFTSAFSTANYCAVVSASTFGFLFTDTAATGSIRVMGRLADNTGAADLHPLYMVIYGDQ